MGLLTDILVGEAVNRGLNAVGKGIDKGLGKIESSLAKAEQNSLEIVRNKKFEEYFQIAEKSIFENCFFCAFSFSEKTIINKDKEILYSLNVSRLPSSQSILELALLDSNRIARGYVKALPAKKAKSPFSSHYSKFDQDFIVERIGKNICNIHIHKNRDSNKNNILLKSDRWNESLFLQDYSWSTDEFKASSFSDAKQFGYIEHNDFQRDALEELYLVYLATVHARITLRDTSLKIQ